MGADTMITLVSAMIHYLQSVGFSRAQLAEYTQLPENKLSGSDGGLSAVELQRLWELIQSRLLPSLTFSLRVRPLITRQLPQGQVRVSTIAEQLNMSRHTLYHKLKEENQTFMGLLNDIRREQAMSYLQDRKRPLAEVAELLGFSELSAFSRAFKRWVGQSPASFRAGIT